MDVKIIRFPIREGKREKWISWCKEIQDRTEEAMKTLQREKVVIESFFIDDLYAYILMISKDHDRAIETVDTDPMPLDIEHRENLQDCLDIEKYEYLESLGDLIRL